MIVVITGPAEDDLESIGDWIASDNPTRALSFVREMRRACEMLAKRPHAYRLVPHHEHTGVRRRLHGDYLIFFRVVGEVVEMLHGARDYAPILFSEE